MTDASLHDATAARFEEEGRRAFPNKLQPYREGTMAATRWAAGFETARRLYVADVDAQTQDTIDMLTLPETLTVRSKPTMAQRLYDAVDEIEADVAAANTDRVIEEIGHCLGTWNVASWQGWTIIRIPGKPRIVSIEATAPNGDVIMKDYAARIGRPLPFDRLDVEKALVPFGAVLAR